MTIQRITILGTGLIGCSVGLALRAHGFAGEIVGWDRDSAQSAIALRRGGIDSVAGEPAAAAAASDVLLLATPVLAILDWMQRLAPALGPTCLVTDVGSVKTAIVERARPLYGGAGQPGFLPGHPMAGREVSGAAYADAGLFTQAAWLFTGASDHPGAPQWRRWVERFGCRVMDVEAVRHDEICAWVSHLPQMLSTALSALLEDRYGEAADLRAIGGRALQEMTRLGASPYSMWRDVAHTNTEPIADAIRALEQRLSCIRQNLKTAELREQFELANRFRNPRS